MKTKNIRIRKKGGGFRMQKVQVLKSGKFKFIKNSSSSKKRRVSKKSTSRTLKRRVSSMARRKRKTTSRRRGMGKLSKMMLGGAMYGVVREPLSQLANRVPVVGGLGDELALLAVSALIASKTKGTLKQIGYAGVVIEASSLGRQLAGGALGGVLGGSSPNTTTSSTVTLR